MATTKLFYGTFGCGHPIHSNRVQVIEAKDLLEARSIMFAMHDSHFCTVYTEEEWNAWIETVKTRRFFTSCEIPLDHIATIKDLRDTTYHTDYTGTEYELKRDYGE